MTLLRGNPSPANGTCPGVAAHKGRCHRIAHKPSGLCARCDLLRFVLQEDRRREDAGIAGVPGLDRRRPGA